MDFSLKQVAAVILSIFVFSIALHSLNEELHKQGSHMQENTATLYVHFEEQLNKEGIVVNTQRKPKIKKMIFHMRKGNYDAFSYLSLIQALDFQGIDITSLQDATMNGSIHGEKAGVNILYCNVFDDNGNYLRYKIAVIIEGNADVQASISNYDEGMLL